MNEKKEKTVTPNPPGGFSEIVDFFERQTAKEKQGITPHPFVATPNGGKCSSCGQLRSASVHQMK